MADLNTSFRYCGICNSKRKLPITGYRAMGACDICNTNTFCFEVEMRPKRKREMIKNFKRKETLKQGLKVKKNVYKRKDY